MSSVILDEKDIRALVEIQQNTCEGLVAQKERIDQLERDYCERKADGAISVAPHNRAVQQAADKFLKSEQIQAVLKGHLPKAGVDIPASALRLQTKSVIVSDSGSGTYLAPHQNIGIASSAPTLVERLRDLIPVSPATSGSIEWLKQTSAKQLAEPQYDGNQSPALRDGAAKKQANMVLVPTTSPIITVAHYVEASRQVLSDNALLADFLQAELFDGVERAIEDQILNGTGTSGEMDGLGNASNYSALTTAVTGDTAVNLIRRAIGQLQGAGYRPDAIVLNAEDWAAIELSTTNEGAFTAGNPRMAMVPSLWGVRVFVSQYLQSGDFVVGAFQQVARLWARQEAVLLMSESHNDNFTKNVMTMLAEARMAITITNSAGVIKSTF